MTAKQKIEDMIRTMSGRYSAYEVFSSWIQCCAIAVANGCSARRDTLWKKREEEYISVIRRFSEEEQRMFAEMFVLLGDALTENLSDVLGEIYMEMEMGSKTAGQFFTPFHVSELVARMAIMSSDTQMTILNGEMVKLNEPSCGGGGMIIAAAKILKDMGVNYQKRMDVVAQDLDWKGVYMCYLQLSLLGISAVVVQGDTLQDPWNRKYPKERTLITPRKAGVLW